MQRTMLGAGSSRSFSFAMVQGRQALRVLNRAESTPPWLRFLLGSLVPIGILVAVPLYLGLTSYQPDTRPLLLLGVFLASWFASIRAGILTTLIAAAVVLFTQTPSYQVSFDVLERDAQSLGIFVVIGLSVNLFAFWRRKAELRLHYTQARVLSLQQNAATLLKSSDPQTVAAAVVSECLRNMGAASGFIAQPRPETQHPAILGAAGCSPQTIEAWTNGADSPLAHAFFTQSALLIRDRTQLHQEYPRFSASLTDGIEGLAVIPLRAKGRRHGVLCLMFGVPKKFGQDEVDLLMAYADQAGDALDRCEAFASIDRQSHEFNIISDASLAFSESEIDATRIMASLVEVCTKYLADSAAAYKIGDDGAFLECVAYRDRSSQNQGAIEGASRAKRIRLGEGLGGVVAVTGRGRLFQRRPPEFPEDCLSELPEGFEENETHSALSVPVLAHSGVLGVLTLERNRPERFGQTHAQLAQELARRAGLALIAAREKAEAAQELERRLRVEDELRKNQFKLEEALVAKDEFLALVSHELRTPLTMIRGNADILRRFPGLGEETRTEAFADLAESSEKLSRIVENMLLLARLEAGRQPDPEPVLLYHLIVRAREEFLRESPKAELRIRSIHNELIVLGNEDYTSQILQNLFSNAVKYSIEGRCVDISIHKEGCFAIVEVADRGIGINPDTTSDLFKAFHRETGQNSDVSGLGIGLTVCKRLVEAQGGRIEARPRENGGSIFSFSLPLWVEDEASVIPG
jgi:signal transduction histidine kinase